MSVKPYVSVCNVANAVQVLELLSVVPECTHKLGVSRVVTRENLVAASGVFRDDPHVFNILHCVDRTGGWNLYDLIEVAQLSAGCPVHAFHLDMTWPTLDVIKTFRDLYPDIALMFQVGGGGMSVAHGDEVRVVNALVPYSKMIDAVVFDRRVDHGRPMLMTTLRRFLGHTKRNLPHLRLAVVEELAENSVDVLSLFSKDFPDPCFHLEAGGCPTCGSTQLLNIEKAKAFLQQIFPVIQRFNTPDSE